MHLVIQIPCFNEAETIGAVIRDLPQVVKGISLISVIVIDDGSSDESERVALEAGANQVVRHYSNRGLAATFMTGIEAALRLGADVIVNTDADGQYPGRFVAALVDPVLDGRAEIVIGDRRPGSVPHFSWCKRMLQRLGSVTLSLLVGRKLSDPVSGFRALTRDVAERMTVTTEFSYTLETLIQAVQQRRAIQFVPIDPEPTPRPSRLAKSVAGFLVRSAATILRVFVLYYPLRSFGVMASLPLVLGLLLIGRFAVLFAFGDGDGHVQSMIIGSLSLGMAFLLAAIGVVAESQRVNRQLLQTIWQRTRRGVGETHPDVMNVGPGLGLTEASYWK